MSELFDPDDPAEPSAEAAPGAADPSAVPTPGDDDGGPGYAEALGELESIVDELDREAVDVDHLSTRVQRASELIALLRRRIDTARMDVSRVVATLDTDPDE